MLLPLFLFQGALHLTNVEQCLVYDGGFCKNVTKICNIFLDCWLNKFHVGK